MSTLLDVADAVVSELNTAFASVLVFPARRQNIPRNKVEELSSPRVTVRPKDRVTTKSTRGIVQDIVRVYVGIQQQCLEEGNDQTDALIELGEDIQAYFDLQIPLAALPGVICENTSFGTDADATWLSVISSETNNVYIGLIVLTFRVSRPGRRTS